jgi:TonB family protein
VLFLNKSHANPDTLYLDRNYKLTEHQPFAYFALMAPAEGGTWSVEVWKNQGAGVLSSKGLSRVKDSIVEMGTWTHYDSLGKRSSENIHGPGAGEGTIKWYYPGGIQLKSEVHYTLGGWNGELLGYHPDGKLRRKEKFFNDQSRGGTSYAPDGKEIAFVPFHNMPDPGFDINDFLSRKLRYPADAREAGKEGRVMVKVVVGSQGELSDFEVLRSVHPSLDAEAIRVIKLMPRWKPATLDDEHVNVYYTIPVNFRLE